MDKKNTIIGAVLIAAAFAFMVLGPKAPPPATPTTPPAAPKDASSTAATSPATAAAATPAAPSAANGALAPLARDSADSKLTTLANDFIEVRFTDAGGAVRDIAFKKRDARDKLVYPAELGGTVPYVFNALHADPMLALVEFPGLDRTAHYELVSSTATEVVHRAVLDNRLEVTRRYTLAPNAGDKTDPYQLRHETIFRNLTAATATIPRLALSVGTAAPISAHDPGDLLTSGYSNGKDQTFIPRGQLEAGSGLFGLGAHDQKPSVTSSGPLVWATLGNQFFTTILTPDDPAASLVTRRVKLYPLLPDEDHNAYGLTAVAQFDVKPLAANGEAKLATSLYVGPKEYGRLANSAVFKADQDKVMQYSSFFVFRFCSQLLITLMNWMHGFTPNWGVAIILSTLLLKLVFVPLTLKSARSMKRMSKLQPQMQVIREKYKDNPTKQHEATMALWKEDKVNPMGGCLPMLIPLPFFIGFFSMLRGTPELRFAPFLWAPDLASTDTVGHLLGISINILPLLFTALTFVQMKLTPTPNADPAQAKMMQFMPLMFLFIYYSMPAALSLYSTANALFTIGQQLLINKMRDPDETPAVTVGPGGKLTKNVTPKK